MPLRHGSTGASTQAPGPSEGSGQSKRGEDAACRRHAGTCRRSRALPLPECRHQLLPASRAGRPPRSRARPSRWSRASARRRRCSPRRSSGAARTASVWSGGQRALEVVGDELDDLGAADVLSHRGAPRAPRGRASARGAAARAGCRPRCRARAQTSSELKPGDVAQRDHLLLRRRQLLRPSSTTRSSVSRPSSACSGSARQSDGYWRQWPGNASSRPAEAVGVDRRLVALGRERGERHAARLARRRASGRCSRRSG